MEEYSETTVWELLKIMQKKVRDNATAIKNNVESAQQLEMNYDKSDKRDEKINSIYQTNHDLTKENTTLLELYNYLHKFHKNFKHLLNTPRENTHLEDNNYREQCMQQTLSGEKSLSDQHPYINDESFMSDLLALSTERELYELCAEIKQVKATL